MSDSKISIESKFYEYLLARKNEDNLRIERYNDEYHFDNVELLNDLQCVGYNLDISSITEKESISNLYYNCYIYKLLGIISKYSIDIKSIDYIDLVNVHHMTLPLQVQFRNNGLNMDNTDIIIEDILIYILLYSIGKYDINLLKDVYYIKDTASIGSVSLVLQTEEYTQNLIRKIFRMSRYKTSIDTKLRLSSSGNFMKVIPKIIDNLATRAFAGMSKYSDNFRDFGMRLYNNDSFIYAMARYIMVVVGPYFTKILAQEPVDMQRLYNDVKRFMESSNRILLYGIEKENLCIFNLEDTVRYYVGNFVKIQKDIEGIEQSKLDVVDVDKCKDLRQEIKRLRKELYLAKRSRGELEEPLEEIVEDSIEESEEVKASTAISIYDKLSILRNKKILILTCVDLDTEQLTENIVVEDANKFKGKSINKDFMYVVKITKGMSHAISYDIDSEIDKNYSKLITTSRRNINLVLDDIIEQL